MTTLPPVLVLGGGPDAERDVSLTSSAAVHKAALDAGLDSERLVIDRPTPEDVASWRDRVVLPILHGRFGEGGTLQRLLEDAGVRFVGCRWRAARLAMDKLATKLEAARAGVPTTPAVVLDPDDDEPPLGLPAVIKPVADGSSVGLHICRDRPAWDRARLDVAEDRRAHPDRVSMVEPFVRARELTAPVLGTSPGVLEALPLVEIAPAEGVYDHAAKYTRKDTRYTVSPDLAEETTRAVQDHAVRLARAIGVRHLARIDFLLPDTGPPLLLEANTMPGFTPTSLFPMSAAAVGMPMPELVRHLVRLAAHD